MPAKVNPPQRRYDSSGRRARAQRSREEILRTSRRLFQEHGYAGTTIATVAREAGVSPETIYNAFGSKAALLSAAATAAIRGDLNAPPLRQRPVIDAIRLEHDPRRQLQMYGRLLAEVNPRLAPLARVMREAAPVDAEIAAALTLLNANRLEGMSEFAALLADRKALRADISQHEARDVLWTLNSPELYELLVIDRGWTAPRYARWVAHTLAAALLN